MRSNPLQPFASAVAAVWKSARGVYAGSQAAARLSDPERSELRQFFQGEARSLTSGELTAMFVAGGGPDIKAEEAEDVLSGGREELFGVDETAERHEKAQRFHIEELVSKGVDLSGPQPVCIWVYYFTNDKDRTFEALASAGWEVIAYTYNESEWSGEDGDAVLRATKQMMITTAAVLALPGNIQQILAGTRSFYTSWAHRTAEWCV